MLKAVLVTVALASLALGCSGKKDPVDRACANLEKVVGEPADRCKAEMPKFLGQCPKLVAETLTCLASATSEEAATACMKPCTTVYADKMAPPVAPELDTPALAAGCKAFGEAIGGGTPAGLEACRRKLAQHAVNCPRSADVFFACMGRAGADDKAGTQCMLECVEAGIKDQK